MPEDAIDKMIDDLIDKAIPEYLKNSQDELCDVDKALKGETRKKKSVKSNSSKKDDEYVFSDRHNNMMNKVFEDVARKERIKKFDRLSRVVAIFMICSLSFGLLCIPNCSAIKEKVKGLFLKDKKWYSILENNSGDGMEENIWTYNGEKIDISPFVYLPLDFDISSFSDDDYLRRITLKKDEEYIKIKIISDNTTKFDTEDIESTYIIMNNIPIKYYEKQGKNNFIYNYKDYTISICSNAEYNILKKIIEKME